MNGQDVCGLKEQQGFARCQENVYLFGVFAFGVR